MTQVIVKTLKQLNDAELEQLNAASKREFQVFLPPRKRLEGRYFFLLKDSERILAMGQLLPISPLIFNGQEFHILGIGGIIANEKGRGFGKQIMTAIREELTTQKITGIGFCKLKNRGFYEKCGFKTDTDSLNRFVYKGQNPMRASEENECLFYQDGADHFMRKVLGASNYEVTIPVSPEW